MKIQCPNCNTVHTADTEGTDQPSRRAVMVLIAIISIAAGWSTGFFSGATLTKPNRQKVAAEITDLKAQNDLLTADMEHLRWNAADHEFSPTVLNPELRTNLRILSDCWADYCRLSTFDSLRGAIGTGKDPHKFQFALECSVKILDELLAQIARRPPIEDEALRKCSQQIVNAMAAEKELHLGFIAFLENKMLGPSGVEDFVDHSREANWAAVKYLVIQQMRFGIHE